MATGLQVFKDWAAAINSDDIDGARRVLNDFEEKGQKGAQVILRSLRFQQNAIMLLLEALDQKKPHEARQQLDYVSSGVREHLQKIIAIGGMKKPESSPRLPVAIPKKRREPEESNGTHPDRTVAEQPIPTGKYPTIESFVADLSEGEKKRRRRLVMEWLLSAENKTLPATELEKRLLAFDPHCKDPTVTLVQTVSCLNDLLRNQHPSLGIIGFSVTGNYMFLPPLQTDDDNIQTFRSSLRCIQLFLFDCLYHPQGKTVLHETICQHLWGTNDVTEDRKKTIAQCVCRLKKNVETAGLTIDSRTGGYRLIRIQK